MTRVLLPLLDVPRDAPCVQEPRYWVFEHPHGDAHVDQPTYARIAVAGCRSCPVWRPCLVRAQANPPPYLQVQGGLVFDRARGDTGKGFTLAQWLALPGAKRRRGGGNRAPVRMVQCEGCTVVFKTASPTKRFCTMLCRKRHTKRARRDKTGRANSPAVHDPLAGSDKPTESPPLQRLPRCTTRKATSLVPGPGK